MLLASGGLNTIPGVRSTICGEAKKITVVGEVNSHLTVSIRQMVFVGCRQEAGIWSGCDVDLPLAETMCDGVGQMLIQVKVPMDVFSAKLRSQSNVERYYGCRLKARLQRYTTSDNVSYVRLG
jgi:hypothetical protein